MELLIGAVITVAALYLGGRWEARRESERWLRDRRFAAWTEVLSIAAEAGMVDRDNLVNEHTGIRMRSASAAAEHFHLLRRGRGLTAAIAIFDDGTTEIADAARATMDATVEVLETGLDEAEFERRLEVKLDAEAALVLLLRRHVRVLPRWLPTPPWRRRRGRLHRGQ